MNKNSLCAISFAAALLFSTLINSEITYSGTFTFVDTTRYRIEMGSNPAPYYPYHSTGYFYRLYTSHDPALIYGFRLDTLKAVEPVVFDSVGPFLQANRGEFIANAIREYMTSDGTIKRFLFEGELSDPADAAQKLAVYEITGDAHASKICEFEADQFFWCNQISFYDTLVYCSSATPGSSGVIVLSFSPSNQTLTYHKFYPTPSDCYGGYRIGSRLFLLNKNGSSNSRLELRMYSVGDTINPLFISTSEVMSEVNLIDQSFAVVADTFLIGGNAVLDTLAFVMYPMRSPHEALWIIDPDSAGGSALVHDTTFLTGASSPVWWAMDTKYVDKHVLFGLYRATGISVSSSACLALRVADIQSLTDTAWVRFQEESENQLYRFVVSPRRDGTEDIYFPLRLVPSGYTDFSNYQKLYRYTFSGTGLAYLPGNWDATNNYVNISDWVGLYNYLLNPSSSSKAAFPLMKGDVNADGYVDKSDLDYLLWYIYYGAPMRY